MELNLIQNPRRSSPGMEILVIEPESESDSDSDSDSDTRFISARRAQIQMPSVPPPPPPPPTPTPTPTPLQMCTLYDLVTNNHGLTHNWLFIWADPGSPRHGAPRKIHDRAPARVPFPVSVGVVGRAWTGDGRVFDVPVYGADAVGVAQGGCVSAEE
ncbi:hypothetical protein P175DRAFT_0502823 [Aspergillus ochraceoroseus IBT 24754]|uniref:Uncharacterized protein n=1 Tax=Aspergillus ochraceoroseus IBT 24754 TaxID=1392256 RepID=A0A2T5LSN3_9EURO|nr:uncharacterized protein P175DRAFT_0502823 [Aspergillus ochraceoroseus IBT 24754]PTU19297.1 hypothetical protein P175DRAFT_0502823 [Aspergillus ochraceoroseus IBT 24754]